MGFQLNSRMKVAALILLAAVLVAINYFVQDATATFSLSDYKNLSIGMSEEEASSTLGKRSKLLYENRRDDGTVVTAYMWTNPDGSFVEARFENGRLRYKTEKGLSSEN